MQGEFVMATLSLLGGVKGGSTTDLPFININTSGAGLDRVIAYDTLNNTFVFSTGMYGLPSVFTRVTDSDILTYLSSTHQPKTSNDC